MAPPPSASANIPKPKRAIARRLRSMLDRLSLDERAPVRPASLCVGSGGAKSSEREAGASAGAGAIVVSEFASERGGEGEGWD